MKVINHTDYETKDLKAIFVRACKEEGTDTDREVTIVYGKKWISGVATLSGTYVKMRLPKNRNKFSRKSLAQVFIHEIGHNLGLLHSDMVNHRQIPVDWVYEYPLRKAQLKEKPVRNLKQERYDHAKKTLETKEKIAKRLTNQIKKWKKKIKYYERTLVYANPKK